MNKGAIQRFAIWARNELIAQVSQRAYQYGITKEGCGEANAVTVGGRALTGDEQKQRKELVDQIRSKGYTQVMEEVAYTWFNRFIALRFMEVNNYLPSHIRVFSDSTGAFKPEILSDVLHLELPGLNREKVAEYIESNDTEGLYRYLLLTQCNALNAPLPRMFEKMGGYTELLLPNNILKQDSVLGHMVADIPEEDWTDQVQIIGWLYQYYNSELKDDTFALLKKNVKITKERIPSATQLFTPDWIVRYMVENSLGRIYVDKRKNEGIYADGRGLDEMTWHEAESERIATETLIADKMGWKYYLPEAEQTQEVRKQLDEIQNEYATLDVKDIKVIDPCMGSGHILVYAFDVLMQIYEASGYSQRDAAQSILENNLYGLDIDDRAAQLAYFAVMMKARQYDRRIFSRGIQPHVYAIVESNGLDSSSVEYFTNNDPKLKKDFGTLMDELRDAKEYGSILNISQVDFAALYARVEEVRADISIFREIVLNSILPLIQVAEVMAQKYDVVVTNPPYMALSNASQRVNDYVKSNYADCKADMFAVFIERCGTFTKKNRYQAMITQHTWMFLGSYEGLRVRLASHSLVSLIHLGIKAFEEIGNDVVQTCTFVFQNTSCTERKSRFCRLVDVKDSTKKEQEFFNPSLYSEKSTDSFKVIPGFTYAYWVEDAFIDNFEKGSKIEQYAEFTGSQNITGNNEKYLRYHWEVEADKVGQTYWVFYAKGGDYRKYFGNLEMVIDWRDSARNFYATNKTSNLLSEHFWFREGVTYSAVTSRGTGFRYLPKGCIFDKGGPSIAIKDNLYYLLALLNSKTAELYFRVLNPSINLQVKDIKALPILVEDKDKIADITQRSVQLAKDDWDSFETSFTFKRHPLTVGHTRVEEAFAAWKASQLERFDELLSNETTVNVLFKAIYRLDDLEIKFEERDIPIRKAILQRDIRSLISYAVGCMFGRYSLDEPGLVYAGGNWDSSKYHTYVPDSDNIIPICDDDYFDDDITGRFVKWVETVYGKETLEENLKFIADALGGKGTPREVIRSYFLNDFYADHCSTYSVTGSGKRPIYWLFDSGKKNGFKALIYMHRYQSDLLARMRTDYVHEQQERYRTQLTHLADAIEHAGAAERVKLTKQQKKLQEQAFEIQKYEEKIHHLADQNIQIDLDDGVKHNYELFADVLAKIK